VIGTSATATPGQSGANISRATPPCSRLTPLMRAAMRMPSAAMLKTPASPPVSAPSASRRSSGMPVGTPPGPK
jgi:hypothetical protein